MSPYRMVLVLDPEDALLLHRLAAHLRSTRSSVLRWALHYYCQSGPWVAYNERREEVLGGNECPASLDIGPTPRRVS